jgi:hypothetical protein
MKAREFKQGIVAYFDILGFKHVAKHEDIASVANLVEATLLRLKDHVENELQRGDTLKRDFTAGFGWLVFADSVLLWCEISPRDFEVYFWHNFLRVCAGLMKVTFNEGLPMRGAISEGRFFVKGHCFVGMPIVECHEEASRAEWAGCSLTRTAQLRLRKLWRSREGATWRTIMEQVCVPYRVPIKKLRAEAGSIARSGRRLAVKWFHEDLWHGDDCYNLGIQDAVLKSFMAHGKRVSSEVQPKLRGTIEFLRHVDTLHANTNTPRQR